MQGTVNAVEKIHQDKFLNLVMSGSYEPVFFLLVLVGLLARRLWASLAHPAMTVFHLDSCFDCPLAPVTGWNKPTFSPRWLSRVVKIDDWLSNFFPWLLVLSQGIFTVKNATYSCADIGYPSRCPKVKSWLKRKRTWSKMIFSASFTSGRAVMPVTWAGSPSHSVCRGNSSRCLVIN